MGAPARPAILRLMLRHASVAFVLWNDRTSAMSERFVGDGCLRLSGRYDARRSGCHGIRGTRINADMSVSPDWRTSVDRPYEAGSPGGTWASPLCVCTARNFHGPGASSGDSARLTSS